MPNLDIPVRVEIVPAWMNVITDSGDINVLPIRENHIHTSNCACGPVVEVVGAHLVIIHNSYDKREFIERAVAIMNGEL